MAKQLAKIGRYWTRTCTCGKEIPYFFLVCPHCKAVLGQQAEEPPSKKSTRIFAQIVAEGMTPVEANLVYTPDQGNNWYRIQMVREEDFFSADLPPMPPKTVIAYFLEAIDVKGKKYVEDNGGQYFFFEVKEEEKPDQELKTGDFMPFQEKGVPPPLNPLKSDLSTASIKKQENLPIGEKITENERQISERDVFNPQSTNVPGFFSEQHRQFTTKKCQCGAILKEEWNVCPICGQKVR